MTLAKAKQNGNTTHYVCAEIETLQFIGGQFDTVVCYSTFPHFHDKPRALENIHSFLKPGGWLYICHTASRETINNIHRNIPGFEDHLLPERSEMAVLIKDAGFKEFEIDEESDSYLLSAKK